MRAKVGVAAKLHLHRGHVEGVGALGLQLVMIDDGMIARYDFRDRVGEVVAAITRVAFNDRGLAIGAGQDERARVGDGRMSVRRGLEDEFNGIFDYRSFCDTDEQAIMEVGCVQGYEGVVLKAGVTG